MGRTSFCVYPQFCIAIKSLKTNAQRNEKTTILII